LDKLCKNIVEAHDGDIKAEVHWVREVFLQLNAMKKPNPGFP